MLDKIKDRFSEPSTYAGLAAVTYGLGEVFKIREADAVAQAIEGAGQAIAVSPDSQGITIGLLGLIGGLVSMFMGEKKR